MNWLTRARGWARAAQRETRALYLVSRHPRTPWHAKLVALVVALYALSPIDLLPDFLPVVGYLDDLILVPAGIAFAIWLTPREVIAECRAQAAEAIDATPPTWSGGLIVAGTWLALLAIAGLVIWRVMT